MDIKQRINKFNTENRPFYIVDHENGKCSLCLAFSFLEGDYKDFGQDAFDRYAGEALTAPYISRCWPMTSSRWSCRG